MSEIVIIATDAVFGKSIAALRHIRGYTQAELATRAGVHVQTVRRLERGECAHRRKIAAVAIALDMPLSRLEREAEKMSGVLAQAVCEQVVSQ